MREHSNYPGRFEGGITIGNVPVLNTYGQDVQWVHSAATSNGKGSFKRPFLTLAAAIAIASVDDVVIAKAGHAETLSAAAAIDFNVAGVNVIGLGTGARRPKLTFDTLATADVKISANSVSLQNIVFSANFADIIRCINVSSAKDARIVNCDFVDTAVNMNWLTPIKSTSTVDSDSDGLQVVGCRWKSPDAAGLEFIEINANMDGLIVHANRVMHEGTASPLVLSAGTKVLSYAEITWNFLSIKNTANKMLVDNGAATNTGIIAHNRVGHADVTAGHLLGTISGGFRLFDNLSVSTDALSGFVYPAIDVDL